MTTTSFLSNDELSARGFRQIGRNVRVSRLASIHMPGSIALGDHARIDDFCVLVGGAGIEVGRHVHIAAFCGLFGGAGIVLEDFSGLSSRVTIYSESDDYSGASLTNPTVPREFRPGVVSGRVALGRHVIVGAGSTLLPGVQLAEGVAVGAHSLVTRSCEEWSIYSGVPARRLKARQRDLLELEREFLARGD